MNCRGCGRKAVWALLRQSAPVAFCWKHARKQLRHLRDHSLDDTFVRVTARRQSRAEVWLRYRRLNAGIADRTDFLYN